MCQNKADILLVLTGGTICSFENEDGEREPNAANARVLIESIFRKSSSIYKDAEFDYKIPFDILSENMTPDRWSELTEKLKEYDMNSYRGVIILHGTDTLAYTSAMLSLVLAGLKIPVFLVSSQLPLNEKKANGNDNFKTAVELLMNGIKPNVYVPYRNTDGKMLVHLGSHLTQCPNHSNDFFSLHPFCIKDKDNEYIDGIEYESKSLLIEKIKAFKNSVLKIQPYVGLDYSSISLDGIDAVVHGTYHSQTLCIGENGNITKYSVCRMKECFGENKIPLFIEPCNYSKEEKSSSYVTTGDAVKHGAVPVWGMTSEMVYVKSIVGVSLGYRKEELINFVKETKINHEFHY